MQGGVEADQVGQLCRRGNAAGMTDGTAGGSAKRRPKEDGATVRESAS